MKKEYLATLSSRIPAATKRALRLKARKDHKTLSCFVAEILIAEAKKNGHGKQAKTV